jgi:hypothetical protein
MKNMTTAEIEQMLRNNEGKRLRVTWDDGVTHSVDVSSVDEEGFLHSGPNGVQPRFYWTRFISVVSVEPL